MMLPKELDLLLALADELPRVLRVMGRGTEAEVIEGKLVVLRTELEDQKFDLGKPCLR